MFGVFEKLMPRGPKIKRRKLMACTEYHVYFRFPNVKSYREWMDIEKGLTDYCRRNFTKTERFIYFMKYHFGWGRRKIRHRTGIAESRVTKCYKKLRDYA